MRYMRLITIKSVKCISFLNDVCEIVNTFAKNSRERIRAQTCEQQRISGACPISKSCSTCDLLGDVLVACKV